jgi:magnesium transporter
LAIYYSDLMDHVNKICQALDEYEDIIEVFKDADFLQSSYRANRSIRTLAVLFAVGLPFLVITGIYVMLPGSVEKGTLWIFLLLLLVIFIIMGATLYFFRRRRLI